MKMTEEQIARERRFGRIAGIIGLAGVLAFILSAFIGSSDYNGADGLADQMRAFAENKSAVLIQLLMQAVAIAVFAAPLMALFRAAQARSEAVRPGLVGLTVAGPIFFAASLIALYAALNGTIDPFLHTPGVDTGSDDAARDILHNQSAYDVYGGLDFAGRLGLVVGIVYTALHSMRTGLMTRFWGTLGMALGVGLLFIGPSALLVFALAASLLVADLWPGGRPPAWAAGVAMPWPKPGEAIAGTAGPVADPEEPASPEDFEGSAEEVPSERPARRDNKRKRKRKQRG
jgi:hypothetical protein